MNYLVNCCRDGVEVQTLADLGAGSGRLAEYLVGRKSWVIEDLHLVEQRYRLMDKCSLPCTQHQNNISRDGIPGLADQSVDVVTSYAFMWTLSHTAAEAVVSEMHRILKPGGVMLAINGFHTPVSAERNNINRHFVWQPDEIAALFAPHDWSGCDGLRAIEGDIWHVISGNAGTLGNFKMSVPFLAESGS